MGVNRVRAAPTIASSLDAPAFRRTLASATSRIPFDTAIPMTIRMPMSAMTENPWPAAISASTIPMRQTGMAKSMTRGRRSDLNWIVMTMKTTITASPSATPSPAKVVRIRSISPT